MTGEPEGVPAEAEGPSAAEYAAVLGENVALRDALEEMAKEHAQLFQQAERTGTAEAEAAQLRAAFRIDHRIAIFARVMDQVAKGDATQDREALPLEAQTQMTRLLEMVDQGSDTVEITQQAARVALCAKAIVEAVIDVARQELEQQRAATLEQAEAMKPPKAAPR